MEGCSHYMAQAEKQHQSLCCIHLVNSQIITRIKKQSSYDSVSKIGRKCFINDPKSSNNLLTEMPTTIKIKSEVGVDEISRLKRPSFGQHFDQITAKEVLCHCQNRQNYHTKMLTNLFHNNFLGETILFILIFVVAFETLKKIESAESQQHLHRHKQHSSTYHLLHMDNSAIIKNNRHRRQHHQAQCTEEGSICATSNAHICKNNTCVSACSIMGMLECRCDSEEDNYCYLCCGSSSQRCLPAHEYGILRNNGERWERESCTRCRMNEGEMEGMACDDMDPQRLCLQGRCSRSVCHDKLQGEYCDRKSEKICVDDICENPCAKIQPHLMVCECPAIDPDTGFASDDRCQLCCYDFSIKPSSRRCQSAHRRYGIESAQSRPIWRIGLDCAGGKRCNRYGVCSNGVNNVKIPGTNKREFSLTLVAIFALLILFVCQ